MRRAITITSLPFSSVAWVIALHEQSTFRDCTSICCRWTCLFILLAICVNIVVLLNLATSRCAVTDDVVPWCHWHWGLRRTPPAVLRRRPCGRTVGDEIATGVMVFPCRIGVCCALMLWLRHTVFNRSYLGKALHATVVLWSHLATDSYAL